MNARERARSVVNAFCLMPDYRMIDPDALDLHMGRLIADAIIAAEEAKAKEVKEGCARECDAIARHYRESVELFENTGGLSTYSADGADRCAFAIRQSSARSESEKKN